MTTEKKTPRRTTKNLLVAFNKTVNFIFPGTITVADVA